MTQKKLEPIGPYTPEHEGPFCTRDGRKARIICLDRAGDFPIIALAEDGEGESLHMYSHSGSHNSLTSCSLDLMNAREVPVAREWWEVVEKKSGRIYERHQSLRRALEGVSLTSNIERWEVIHVREVLPEVADISPAATGVPEMEPGKDHDGLLSVVAWGGRDFHSDYELGFTRDRDRDFLDEQPSSGEVAWYPLVRQSDALREIEKLRHALREARTSISSLVNAKPPTTASQGANGGGHVQ